jgi:hypothetical protein
LARAVSYTVRSIGVTDRGRTLVAEPPHGSYRDIILISSRQK